MNRAGPSPSGQSRNACDRTDTPDGKHLSTAELHREEPPLPVRGTDFLEHRGEKENRLSRTSHHQFFDSVDASPVAYLALLAIFGLGGLGLGVAGCVGPRPRSTLDAIYGPLARLPDFHRNPVVVIPGVLGSRLVDNDSGQVVWGKFNPIRFRRRTAADMRGISLPMSLGTPLSELRDDVRSDGTLAELSLAGIPVELEVYDQMLLTLGVGGYRDPQHPKAGEVDYGQEHFTCFQFDYDWRRDLAENAGQLEKFLHERRDYIREEYARRYGIEDAEIKFDIVAHSMGGLLARYYLRYGGQQLPEEKDSLPELDWRGAENVDRVVLVGTPNSGSTFALNDLVTGHHPAPLLPEYPPAALGTLPAIYQLLPRPRHQVLVRSDEPSQSLDFYDPELWRRLGWGLADPGQANLLRDLLPDVQDEQQRRAIALDHQRKCLAQARQMHRALDVPAAPPPGVSLHLYAGDAIETPAVLSANLKSGELSVLKQTPGDDTTTRHSALMNEHPVGAPFVPPRRFVGRACCFCTPTTAA